jgi:20S proteasome alpha/beta subunit
VTIAIGLLCEDGIVIGADSSATFTAGQFPTIEQRVARVFPVGEEMLHSGTGRMGVGQRLHDILLKQKKTSLAPRR